MSQERMNMSTYQKTALGTTMAGLGMQSCSTMLFSYVLTSIIADFAISSTAGGAISTITNLGMLAGGIIFGTLADKYGRVKIFAITVAIFSIATGLTACSTSITAIYVLRFLVGVGGGGEYGVIMSIIADSFAEGKRGRITSFVTIAGQLGSIIAAIGAALIIPTFGWRGLFVFGALPIFLAVFILWKLPESEAWKAVKKESVTKKSGIRDLFTEGRAFTTIRLTIMAIVQVAGYFGLMNWLPSILQNKAGLSISGSSIWMIATIIGMSLGMLVFGQIMDKIGAKTAYASFLIASAIAVFAYSFADSAMLILVGGAIVGFFANGMNAGYGAIVGNLYPTHIRATANNIIFNIGRAIGGFSSIAIGFFLDNYSLTVAMAFLTVLYCISLITVTTLQIHKPKPAETQA